MKGGLQSFGVGVVGSEGAWMDDEPSEPKIAIY